MINYEKIQNECFWEYNFDEKEIQKIASSDDLQMKRFLFEKILLNSTTLFNDLKIFSKDDLGVLITGYKVPSFNHDYIFKRKNMAEVYFLNKHLLIDELQWVS